jgi:hypothetical protein
MFPKDRVRKFTLLPFLLLTSSRASCCFFLTIATDFFTLEETFDLTAPTATVLATNLLVFINEFLPPEYGVSRPLFATTFNPFRANTGSVVSAAVSSFPEFSWPVAAAVLSPDAVSTG